MVHLDGIRNIAGRSGAVAALLVGVSIVHADLLRTLASYEPYESDLTLARGAADAGLTLSMVYGGRDGAPLATHGEYVLKLSFSGEDGKIEYRHDWWQQTYGLAEHEALQLDVFVAAAGALPNVMGVYSTNWDPPGAWQSATAPPAVSGQWVTVSFPLNGRTQTDLTFLHAIVFEQMSASDGVIYVDHLRLVRSGATLPPTEVATLALSDRSEVAWPPVHDTQLAGYHVYVADSASGPFTRLTTQPMAARHYVDTNVATDARYYAVSAVGASGESALSTTAMAQYNGVTDEQLLDITQQTTFNYFWYGAHPVSGMAVEPWDANACAVGGSGMGLMALIVGAERGWAPRAAVANRMRQILAFLEDVAVRYHGAWPHVVDGTTGEVIGFGTLDDGADLIETSYVAQGLLTVRQYFDGGDAVETEIRTRATRLWEEIEFDWFRRYPESLVLWWHWSPNHGWALDLPIRGYHEGMIAYLLAIASPTHPMPPESYYGGWTSRAEYANGATYFDNVLDVSEPLGGPLFFTHYSALGFDPRFKRDNYTNYFYNAAQFARIHRAYAVENPHDFAGYHRWGWGLTASMGPFGYQAHSPTNDSGTIAPTAALSSMPYTPAASLETLRFLFDTYQGDISGTYGLYDAYNPTEDWFATDYISIDQGPIIVMIENYRTGLLWRLFMSNQEIRPALAAMGWWYEPDLNHDGRIGAGDGLALLDLLAGPSAAPIGDPEAVIACDNDDDDDVDMQDLAWMQALVAGT